jgi:quercetin dioxygenase-like cupin family protein
MVIVSPMPRPLPLITLTCASAYGEEAAMDVRSIEGVPPVVEHNGTVPVWWLVNPREMKEITDGGFLELVSEFEVSGGGSVDPHSHPTHEFYYVTSGGGS